MKAKFLQRKVLEKLKRLGYSEHSQIRLTVDREYKIYCVVIWSDVTFFCVINDLELPAWIPSSYFSMVDKHPASDWIFNEIDDEVLLILGPDFIAKDKGSYASLVEHKPEAIKMFWEYVDSHL
ncbi:MAG: hypothetical protein WA191_13120 [Telluria sp.]